MLPSLDPEEVEVIFSKNAESIAVTLKHWASGCEVTAEARRSWNAKVLGDLQERAFRMLEAKVLSSGMN
jgi:hypothetical protein